MPESGTRPAAVALDDRPQSTSKATERALILEVLKETGGRVGGPDGAAARLGFKRTTLQSRMRKYNIARQFE
jgi:formate hydrogenlyase transcriptional activator